MALPSLLSLVPCAASQLCRRGCAQVYSATGTRRCAAGSGREWGLLLDAAALLWFMLQTVAAWVQAQIIQKGNPS